MTHSPNNRVVAPIIATGILCLLVMAGCEEKYKPAAYKPAPRVNVGDSGSNAKLPDVTAWTSPEAMRAAKGFPNSAARRGGYRGDAYRGYGNRNYSGITRAYRGYGNSPAYRGYGNSPTYRGYGKSPAYRGYGGSEKRSYRGYENNNPSSTYRGYRR